MRATETFIANVPFDRVNLYRWVTEMTSDDYESFTPAHKGMGSFWRGSRFFMVNVECIGTDMLVQRYELVEYSASHVKFYSRRTKTYILRWFPVTFSVPWEMTLRPVSDRSCELRCTIGADFPSALLGAIAWIGGSSFFLRRHLATEGAAFAKNLELKFGS